MDNAQSLRRQRDLSDIAGTWVDDPTFEAALADQDSILPFREDLEPVMPPNKLTTEGCLIGQSRQSAPSPSSAACTHPCCTPGSAGSPAPGDCPSASRSAPRS